MPMSSRPVPITLVSAMFALLLAAAALTTAALVTTAASAAGVRLPVGTPGDVVADGVRQVVVGQPELLANPIIVMDREVFLQGIAEIVVERPQLLANPVVIMQDA
jgi:hypothetical protein